MGHANTLAIELKINLLKPNVSALRSAPRSQAPAADGFVVCSSQGTLYPKSLKRFLQSSPSPSPLPRPFREVLSPISFKEDAPSAHPSHNSERRGPGREDRGARPWESRMNERRGWAGCGGSQTRGNPRGSVKTLTNILIEGVGGKERHVRCVPRCPRGLPLDTAAL